MTLYEYIQENQHDYDVYDANSNTGVTVCYIEKEDNSYEIFCNEIIKKVDFIAMTSDSCLIANWSDLVERNMMKFRDFNKTHGRKKYEDIKEGFVYHWVKEIHFYMAGYETEDFYNTLNEFVESLT